MKATFKILISTLALGVLATSPLLRAQDDKAPAAESPKGGGKGGRGGRGAGMNADDRIAAIEKAVGTLSSDQKAKIKDILAKQREAMQAARSGGGGGGGREKMQAAMKAVNDEIRAVLTPDQQKKFDEMPRPERGGGGKGGRKKNN
jgi:Spy/CpxP family protein refolding chaperone